MIGENANVTDFIVNIPRQQIIDSKERLSTYCPGDLYSGCFYQNFEYHL
jgi:hypothetical protein